MLLIVLGNPHLSSTIHFQDCDHLIRTWLAVRAAASLDASLLFPHLLRLFRHSDVYSSSTYRKRHTLIRFHQAKHPIAIHSDLHQSRIPNKDVTANACRFSHRDAGTYPIRPRNGKSLDTYTSHWLQNTGSTNTLIRCQLFQSAPTKQPRSLKHRQEP
jgi:hypothetical protein